MNADQQANKVLGEALQVRDTSLPAVAAQRGLSIEVWNALTTSVFPGAKPQSVIMAVDYCKARGLDILKKPVHIVPMQVQNKTTGDYDWRDIVMPGINEARITASRTGQYAGQDEPRFGPMVAYKGLNVPEWCTVTVYRIVSGVRCGFSNTERYEEAVVEKKDKKTGERYPNDMWQKRRFAQLAKCAEAGALRKGFPEELGGQQFAEEMHGRIIEAEELDAAPTVPPAAKQYHDTRTSALREALEGKTETGQPVVAVVASENLLSSIDAALRDAQTAEDWNKAKRTLETERQNMSEEQFKPLAELASRRKREILAAQSEGLP